MRICSSEILDSIEPHEIYSLPDFKFCVGIKNSRFPYSEFLLPGSSEFTSFTIKGNKIAYSRINDPYYFRTIELPKVADYNAPKYLNNAISNLGPKIGMEEHIVSKGRKINILPTNRGPGVDVLQIDSQLKNSKFTFWPKLIQSFFSSESSSKDVFYESKNIEKWDILNMAKYSLGVGDNFNRLNKLEKDLITSPPIVEQISKTLVFYFYITQVVLTIDTVWDANDIELQNQYHVVHPKAVERIGMNNDEDITRISIDDSGTIFVISKHNGDLMIFNRNDPLISFTGANQENAQDTCNQKSFPPLKNINGIKSKSIIKKFSQGQNSTLLWNHSMSWVSGLHSSSDIWADTDNEGSNYHNQLNFMHPNLIGIDPHISKINFHASPNLSSPSFVGDYFISIRVYKSRLTEKHIPDSRNSKINKGFSILDLIEMMYRYFIKILQFFDFNFNPVSDTKSAYDYIEKDTSSNTIASRLSAVQRDGKIILFSLDNKEISNYWLAEYLYTKYEMILSFSIITLIFVYNESKYAS
ncbi:hypothetical protein AYI69_g9192 [Smittium culicis]|uniref:Uncharacterized protein n=1 Tax=Smittium culicis TaxID=133412 RepID=A0A1R1XEB0_9FUNG|nr:hypothetical protein AYI69_g9192 [Smittium culicis]